MNTVLAGALVNGNLETQFNRRGKTTIRDGKRSIRQCIGAVRWQRLHE